VTPAAKVRRATVWLPVVAICAWAGGWLGVILDPHGMNFGTPLAERLVLVLQPSANPPIVLALNAMVGASLLLADLVTPRAARIAVLLIAGLFAGALYYELFLGNYIDTWFEDWPPIVGEVAALSSLVWPHLALAAAKLVAPTALATG
jgi:hypothetical protein